MTCFVFFLSFPLSLPFDWTFEILSICLLFCFVIFWMLCYDVVYEKEKMLIKKKEVCAANVSIFGDRFCPVHSFYLV